ncbi:hypothetical protein QCA50_006770 [Cerrena zonata]|uniref:CN hydrolase domain-containing protein n=1 Tax=Cerrena zonata TaxID=2478898 RepID=A0AAW0GKN2_9APHY
MAPTKTAETRQKLRVAVVQFDPKIGEVQENITKATKLCSQLRPHTVDLVCLPELIFTGYVFSGSEHISPYLEEPGKGPTSRFCSSLAKQLSCYVTAGYPERLASHERQAAVTEDGQVIQQVGANSAVVYDPQGKFVGNYRKTNLYETDMTWARRGTGFMTLHLPQPLGTVCLGICMDLNTQPPAVWSYDYGPYEMADHCIQQNANVLILLNAWLDSKQEPEKDRDWSTLEYWAARLRPLWSESDDGFSKEGQSSLNEPKKTNVIICNRTGEENGVTFAGTSALFSFRRGSGKPLLLQTHGRRSEGVGIWIV